MALSAFVSYSHADEKAWERLQKHLAMLEREGLFSTWYDRAILAGEKVDQVIFSELDRSAVFLALVSPDYLASRYCYDREFQHALELVRAGKLRLVPVILEPCDWLSSPLSEFMALPKDGKPISEWANANNAYLDIVTGLRRIASESGPAIAASMLDAPGFERTSGRQVRVKRDFDAIERSVFADAAFETIQSYFRDSAAELAQVSDDLRTRFEEMSPTAFTCSVVNRALQRGGEAHITVHNMKGRRGMGDISYVYERYAQDNTSNGSIRVEADDYNMFMVNQSFHRGRDEEAKLTPERAAEWLWNEFVERAGVEYE